MKHAILLLTFCVFATLLCAQQKYDNIWLLGEGDYRDNSLPGFPNWVRGGILMDFAQYPPTLELQDFPIHPKFKAHAIACDRNGELVAYTNGCDVVDYTHQLMLGGDSLQPGIISTYYCGLDGQYPSNQEVTFLPDFQDPDRFHLFHLEKMYADTYETIPRRFFHSIVQRPADGGPAALVSKKIIYDQRRMDDGFAAVRHANGRDWWLILTNFRSFYDDPDFPYDLSDPTQNPWPFIESHPELFLDTLRFTRFLFTPDSLYGPFPEQEVDATLYPNQTRTVAFSPDGSKYIIAGAFAGSKLFDFDRCTGLMSNPFTIDDYSANSNNTIKAWAVFSPDSRYLYLNNSTVLVQIDLNHTPLEQVPITQLSNASYYPAPGRDNLGIPLAGPDGKLYITNSFGRSMHRLDFPNRAGSDCGFRPHCIALPTINELRGNFNYPNFRLGPLDGSACDSLGIDNIPLANFRYDVEDTIQPLLITFTDLTDYLPDTWEWDFGDGQSSVLQNPQHLFAQPGTYTVCLRTLNSYGADTICKVVNFNVVGASHIAPSSVNLIFAPNPTNGPLVAILNGIEHPLKLVIRDCFGNPVLTKQIMNGINLLDVSDLSSGLYFYEATQGGILLSNGKVVKME